MTSLLRKYPWLDTAKQSNRLTVTVVIRRRCLVDPSRPFHALHRSQTSSFWPNRLQIRAYSSNETPNPTPESAKGLNADDPPSPVIPPAHLKPRKVDLHPAPKKFTPDVSNSAPSPSISPSTSLSSSLNSEKPPSNSNTTELSSTSSAQISPERASAPGKETTLDQVKADLKGSEVRGVLAPPPEGASRIGKLVHQAKELFKFYWGGIKAQWQHHQMVGEIHQRIKEEAAVGNHQGMTRWESQFVRTHKRDVVKLVPFLLILIILEEALPLIVIYAPSMLPSTTILPSQAERIYKKQEEKKAEAILQAQFYLSAEERSKADIRELGINGMSDDLAWTTCRAFSLSDRGPRSWVNQRLAKHLTYIAEDDALIIREGSGENLTLEELRTALGERGHLTDGLTDVELRKALSRWLKDARGEKEMIGSFLSIALETDLSTKSS